MISLAIAVVLSFQSPGTFTLVRGGEALGSKIWDVEDTTLDATAPNTNFGGENVLTGGPNKRILIRFGDIARVVPPGQKIRSASLVFTTTAGGRPVLRNVSVLHNSWGEGPYQTLSSLLVRPVTTTPDKPAKDDGPPPPKGSATWRQRRGGDNGATWQQPGANGANDATPVEGAKLNPSDKDIRIEGLAKAVQEMADRPYDNDGFSISFEADTELASSQSSADRPRLELELENGSIATGPDLSVVSIERLGSNGKLPNSGDTARFLATVKNVGTAPATGFTGAWVVDERAGGSQDNTKTIAAGESVSVPYEIAFKPDGKDHRFQSVEFRIKPKAEDQNPRNDALIVNQGAKPIEVVLSPSAVVTCLTWHVVPEEWVQETATIFNDVYCAQSRFSFAPEGALERIAVQRIRQGDLAGEAAEDGSARIKLSFNQTSPAGGRLELLRKLALAAGLTDRSATSLSPSNNALSTRGAADRFPGLLDYGDTRFEGFVPGSVELPYEPYVSPMVDAFPLDATGLLAATDVAALNAGLGGPALEMPHTILIRASNDFGIPLIDLEMAFFQSVDGKFAKDAQPAFSLHTASGGTALFPNRDGGPFGKLTANDGNGVYLVRATANGVTAWSSLKVWQAYDTAARGSRAAAIMDLHFSLPDAALDQGTNLSADRIITDSTGALPAKLAALIDGSSTTEATLGGKPNDWVEIDLGRDRTVGEISLIGEPGAFWGKYDLATYSTGQRPEEALVWVRELDGYWTFNNRREPLTGGSKVSVSYHGQPRRFRYLRIINRSGALGKLSEIKVTPAVVGQ